MTAYSWGSNGFGGLGVGSGVHHTPTGLVGSPSYSSIRANVFTGMGLTAGGQVYVWGNNEAGQLGQGTSDSSTHNSPVLVSSLSNIVSIEIGLSGSDLYAITATGDLYVWGDNNSGELGLGDTTQRHSPVLSHTGVRQVVGGNSYTILLLNDGTLVSAGNNFHGQLGTGDTTSRSSWTSISPPAGTVVKMACGGFFSQTTVLLYADGVCHGVGASPHGELGNTNTDNLSWVTLPFTNAIDVQMSGPTFVVRNDGTVWAIGTNDSATLGIGDSNTATQYLTPVQVVLPAGVTCLRLAPGGVALIGSDNLVYTWGDGTSGQMGDGGTTAINPTPISVNGVGLYPNDLAITNRSVFVELEGTPLFQPVTRRGRSWAAVIG